MPTLFNDLETYSDVPIGHGTHAYAERAEVLIWTYAIDDGPVQCWDRTASLATPTDLLVALNSPDVLQVWHNGGGFDRVVLGKTLPPLCPPVERVHDTMAQALAHSLPGSLDQLGEVLGIPQDERKHKRGRELVLLFCKPRPKTSKIRRATRETHPAEWAEFVEYAKADILAMRAIYKVMPTWNYKGAELDLWRLDQRINDRGVAMDLDLARSAIRAVERAQASLAVQCHAATGGDVAAATQRDKLLAHILGAYGITLPDMTIDTLERRMNDPELPEPLRELLAIRLQASKTSGAKYKRVVEATSWDGRLRGLLQFCGASRTGRWAGRLFQPQNLPRPTHKQALIDQGIEAMKADCEDLIADDVMALASSAIRGCIVAPPGKKLVVADLANIEGRGIAWLAGEEWKLDAFRAYDEDTGPDLYKLAYSKAFGISPDDVVKDQRQIGKVMELMLGYEGGVGAFLTGAATYGIDLDAMAEAAWPSIPAKTRQQARDFMEWLYGQDRKTSVEYWLGEHVDTDLAPALAEDHRRKARFGLTEKTFIVCDSLKRMWREAHPAVSSFWKELQEAAVQAVNRRGVLITCRRLKLRRDGAWLRIGLPSGRCLCYPSPQAEDGKVSYYGVNQYSRKWQRLKTYGGKLAENVTQAVSRDVLAASMPAIEAAGYQIVLTVHDEIIAEAPDLPEFNADHLAGLMSANPPWADGLPLAAAGFEALRYRKD